jgi:hypothetical protein
MQWGQRLSYALMGILCCCTCEVNFAMESGCLKYRPDQFIVARACWIGEEDEIEEFLSNVHHNQNDTKVYEKLYVKIDKTAKIIKTSISAKESVDLPYDEFKVFLRDRALRQCARDLLALILSK